MTRKVLLRLPYDRHFTKVEEQTGQSSMAEVIYTREALFKQLILFQKSGAHSKPSTFVFLNIYNGSNIWLKLKYMGREEPQQMNYPYRYSLLAKGLI